MPVLPRARAASTFSLLFLGRDSFLLLKDVESNASAFALCRMDARAILLPRLYSRETQLKQFSLERLVPILAKIAGASSYLFRKH